MTDPASDSRDELASAHLDGLTSEEEHRLIATDPVLIDRVERLRAVRDAIRLPDRPVDDDRRDRTIAAALAVADEGPWDAASLPAARARRAARSRRAQLIAVAAAVALAALVVPRLVDSDDRSGSVVAAPEQDDATAQAGASTLAPPDGGAADGSASAEASPLMTDAPVEIGPVADIDDLARRLAHILDSETPAASSSSTSPPTPAEDDGERAACLASIRADLEADGGSILLMATATLHDEPVVAIAAFGADGVRRLEVATLPSCAQLASRPL